MINSTQIRFAPAVTSMRDYLEPHLAWLEKVVGCAYPETVTFEIDLPIGQLVIEDMLDGVPLDGELVSSGLRAAIDRWELAGTTSPRIHIALSRKRGSCIVERETAWHAEWRDCPIAVWLKGERAAFVAAEVPFVSFRDGLRSDWKSWLIVSRASAASVLNRLGSLIHKPSKQVRMFGGGHLSFTPNYDWDAVVLDPVVAQLVRDDYESFFKRERWFRDHGLPFRRGYLFYGSPGNGKTTVIKVMASHPAVTPLTLDFCHECLNNESLTGFFEMAAQNAPSLVIFEDLDRAFIDDDHKKPPQITLQHFLNCLDGIGTEDGVIVVATANDPSRLDAAILKRPGRFDRVVAFHPPDRRLCAGYLHHLSRGALDPTSLKSIACEAEGLSFAQLRESYILAGQLAYETCSQVRIEHLRSGLRIVGRGMAGVNSMVGFHRSEAAAIITQQEI
jgi:hypothetical protein